MARKVPDGLLLFRPPQMVISVPRGESVVDLLESETGIRGGVVAFVVMVVGVVEMVVVVEVTADVLLLLPPSLLLLLFQVKLNKFLL